MINIDPRLLYRLQTTYAQLLQRGGLLSPQKLQAGYAAFLDHCGPDRLRSLDGEALLHAMHTHGNRASMVYWLEFKNDEEFPGREFGSIAGGSAHKFGLFRRKDTEQWVSGSPQNETPVSVQEAIEIARKHRSQLLAGVDLIEKLPDGADDRTYLELQTRLDEVAPDVAGLAWGHKYFSLLFPDKLDDYHNHKWQRYNLIKLLQLPPEAEGLYASAGRYVQIARQLNWRINHLTAVLNEMNGQPKAYWRIGTRLGEGNGADIWPAMRDGGYAAIGWDWIGNLADETENSDLKNMISERLGQEAYEDVRVKTRKAGEIRNFIQRIQEDDVILAAHGQTIVGVGLVKGGYRFEPTPPKEAPHRREVEWRSVDPWNMPVAEGLRTTVYEIGKREENLIEAERRLLGESDQPVKPVVATAPARVRRLEGVVGQVQKILERKGQVILFGPPGTGKTHWARKSALDLAGMAAFGRLHGELPSDQAREIEGGPSSPGLVRMCTFHPAYGYEDFIEGYRPQTSTAGQLTFAEREGIFKKLCQDAAEAPDRQFFLLIDEINRGDIPRIFGELLTLLEMDKRGLALNLPASGRPFSVPANVRVIGTMNTADHSIALIDTALRRRFGFIELLPDTTVLGQTMIGDAVPIGPWLGALNDRIRTHLGRDGRNLQIGHAYFLHAGKPVEDFAVFVRILAEDIIPLLQEYCYEDFGLLEKLLGEGLVDSATQTIRNHLFVAANRDALVQALLEPAPEIVTSREAKPAEPATEDQEAEVGEP